MELPAEVRRFFGHALHFAQNGEQHDAAKVLKGFGGAGVLEVVEDDAGEPTGLYIRCGSKRRSLFCIASRRRANGGLRLRNAIWRRFIHG